MITFIGSTPAALRGIITHARGKQLSSEHRGDITAKLSCLVQNGFFLKIGDACERVYYFANFTDIRTVPAQARRAMIIFSRGWPRLPRRLASSVLREIIFGLCADKLFELKVLAKDLQGLHGAYLNPMVSEGLLGLRYPAMYNRLSQAYPSTWRKRRSRE